MKNNKSQKTEKPKMTFNLSGITLGSSKNTPQENEKKEAGVKEKSSNSESIGKNQRREEYIKSKWGKVDLDDLQHNIKTILLNKEKYRETKSRYAIFYNLAVMGEKFNIDKSKEDGRGIGDHEVVQAFSFRKVATDLHQLRGKLTHRVFKILKPEIDEALARQLNPQNNNENDIQILNDFLKSVRAEEGSPDKLDNAHELKIEKHLRENSFLLELKNEFLIERKRDPSQGPKEKHTDAEFSDRIAREIFHLESFATAKDAKGNLIYSDVEKEDTTSLDACKFSFLMIGHCIQSLSQDFKDKHSDVLWKEIKNFENKIIHESKSINKGAFINLARETVMKLGSHSLFKKELDKINKEMESAASTSLRFNSQTEENKVCNSKEDCTEKKEGESKKRKDRGYNENKNDSPPHSVSSQKYVEIITNEKKNFAFDTASVDGLKNRDDPLSLRKSVSSSVITRIIKDTSKKDSGGQGL